MPVKKLFDVGQGEVIVFIYVSYLTRESTLYFLNVNKYWHDRKRWEKEANMVSQILLSCTFYGVWLFFSPLSTVSMFVYLLCSLVH
jgi:hypothetical protein